MKTTFNDNKRLITGFAIDAIAIGASMLIAYQVGYKYGCKTTRTKDLKSFYHFNPEVATDFMKHCSEVYVKHSK